jgi:hypothetical protein
MAETLQVQGTGGARFEVDIPAEGTPARQRLDADIESGALLVLKPPAKPVTPTPAKKQEDK